MSASDKQRAAEKREEELRINQGRVYQMNPPPPEMTEQECILKYLNTKDPYFFKCYLHMVEKKLNCFADSMAVRYSMLGFFPDIKQAAVEGMIYGLKQYDPDQGTPFWWYAKEYFMPEAVHDFIRMARPGFTVDSRTRYRNLRKVMQLHHQLADEKKVRDPVKAIADQLHMTEKTVNQYLMAGLTSSRIQKMERDDDEVVLQIPYPDYTQDPGRQLFARERHEILFSAYFDLSERERYIIAMHLGFCEKCLNTKEPDEKGQKLVSRKRWTFEEIAVMECMTAKAVRQIYDRAIEKLRKAMPEYYFEPGPEDDMNSFEVF